MSKITDKEIREALARENARVRWWHFIPFVGLAACAVEDATFPLRDNAAIRSTAKGRGNEKG